MTNTDNFLQKNCKNFQAAGETRPQEVIISREELMSFSGAARTELDARLAFLTATDNPGNHSRFELLMVLHIPGDPRYVIAHIPVSIDDPVFPSLTGVFPNANWPEREIRDMFGITPKDHPDPRPLVWKGGWPKNMYPLRKDFAFEPEWPIQRILHPIPKVEGEGIFEIPVGPIHAGIIEPGHFRFQAVGDTMIALDAQLFFCHRGIEKLGEGKDPESAILLAERQCGTCSVSNALSFCLAAEQAAGVQIPPRGRALRVFLSEFERLYNHVNDVAAIVAGVGFAFATQQGLRLKEEFQRLAAAICGHRFLRNILMPGGMRQDFDPEKLKETVEQMKDLVGQLKEAASTALDKSTFLDRLETTGILTLKNALELRAVGPVARASGVKADTRVDHPYDGYQYQNLPSINIQTRSEGDVMARFRMRLDEITASIALVEAVQKNLPDGPIRVAIPEIKTGAIGLGATESPRGENLCLLKFGAANRISRYAVRTASYCNWPCIPTTIQGNIIPDFPLINKSFELCYADVDR